MYLKKTLKTSDLDDMRDVLSHRKAKLYPDPVCDICGSDVPVVVYAANRMSTGEVRECWRWTACQRCSRDIDNDNWEAIRRRLIQWLNLKTPKALAHLMPLAADHVLNDFKQFATKEGE